MVIGIFASYFAVYGLVKVAKGNPEPVKPKKVSVPKISTPKTSASGYEEPTWENLDKWLENPKNIEQWEKSLQ